MTGTKQNLPGYFKMSTASDLFHSMYGIWGCTYDIAGWKISSIYRRNGKLLSVNEYRQPVIGGTKLEYKKIMTPAGGKEVVAFFISDYSEESQFRQIKVNNTRDSPGIIYEEANYPVLSN